jgi:RNA polymerase sigma factor (TIGR02999 family)
MMSLMTDPARADITQLLVDWSRGDESALAALMPLVYDELRRLAQNQLRAEPQAHTLQRTALVHEAFLRLVDQKNAGWQSRMHFYGLAAQMMRRVLVDHARRRGALKRGSDLIKVDVNELETGPGAEELVTLDSAIDFEEFDSVLKRLEAVDARQGRLVELRFFGGLSLEEAAEVLGISLSTAKRDWNFARAWLQRELKGP